MGPKNGGLGAYREYGVKTLDIGYATPKRHFLARNRVVSRILLQNQCARLGSSLSQEPPPQRNSRVTVPRDAKSRMRRTETPKLILHKILHGCRHPRRSHLYKFWLRGFRVAGSNFPPFP